MAAAATPPPSLNPGTCFLTAASFTLLCCDVAAQPCILSGTLVPVCCQTQAGTLSVISGGGYVSSDYAHHRDSFPIIKKNKPMESMPKDNY